MKRPRKKLFDDPSFVVRREHFARVRPDAWFRSEKHLAYVRTLRCRACGSSTEIEAAHVRKGTDGAGSKKPSDVFVNPLCTRCHKIQHLQGEPMFWGDLDPIRNALQTAINSPCPRTREAAFEIYKSRYG